MPTGETGQPGSLPRGSAAGGRGEQSRSRMDKPGVQSPTWHTKSCVTRRGPNLRPGVIPRAEIGILRLKSTLSDCRWEL